VAPPLPLALVPEVETVARVPVGATMHEHTDEITAGCEHIATKGGSPLVPVTTAVV
jgi:hypothetical protein